MGYMGSYYSIPKAILYVLKGDYIWFGFYGLRSGGTYNWASQPTYHWSNLHKSTGGFYM